jgi:1-aminocyclopropane-1-carboxylate deaminase/D-cysteine desulfhydrase-like pyridoxal-dependent ACC family enzyme
VLVAAGSGGTAAGLAAADGPWRLVVAAVSRLPAETRTRILQLRDEVAAAVGAATPGPVDVRDARGPGYGLPSPDGDKAARLAADTEGMLVDPVFSAKALGLLVDGSELPDPVVFWHTGGTAVALAHIAEQIGGRP